MVSIVKLTFKTEMYSFHPKELSYIIYDSSITFIYSLNT